MEKILTHLQMILFGIMIAFIGSLSALENSPEKKGQNLPPIFVRLGSPNYTWQTFFTGLALQPFANNLDYAIEALPFNYTADDMESALSPDWVVPQISTDLHFAFDVGIAQIFKSAHSSLMLNWERFHSSNDSAGVTVPSTNDMVGPFFEIGGDGSFYKVAKGNVWFHFDEVNFDYGTFVNFGPLLHMNLFAGVGFTRLLEHRFTRFFSTDKSDMRTIEVPSKFLGAGPQVGLDFTYKIVKGFQFVGATRGTLFVGKFYNSTDFSTTSTVLIDDDSNPSLQNIAVRDKQGMVPGFEGKLGLAYEYLYRCHYRLKVEAGYQAQVYINSIRTIDVGSEIILNTGDDLISTVTGVYARTFQRVVSDFGLAGPYASVDFAF